MKENNNNSRNDRGNGRKRNKVNPKVMKDFKNDDPRNKKNVEKYMDRCNDPMWYAKNPQLLKDAASLAFSNRTGDYMDFGVTNASQATGAIPGIMALEWVPSVGTITNTDGSGTPILDNTDAINCAAKNIYSFVRHANSGASNYDAPDLAMAIVAADSVFSMIAHAIRAYGLMRVWDQKNRYVPKAMLSAVGISGLGDDYSLADFRYDINYCIAKSSVIWVPSNLTFITRHFWMNSNVYKDGDNPKSQLYVYRQVGWWKFSGTFFAEGSGCMAQGYVSSSTGGSINPMTAKELIAVINDLLDPIIEDEDLGIMFGDILKAYGKENIYSINEIAEDYTVLPVFSKEVLMQIHNSLAYPVGLNNLIQDADTNTIYESALYLPDSTSDAQKIGVMCIPPKFLFDYEGEIPEPENIMVSSRLMPTLYGYKVTGGLRVRGQAGSERLVGFRMWWYDATNALRHSNFWSFYSNTDGTELTIESLHSKFDWAPYIYIVVCTDTTNFSNWTLRYLFGDMENYTIVDYSVLNKMHKTAIFSQFDIPLQL